MSKLRTENDIQDVLDQEISWRIHEISYLKKTLVSVNTKRKNSVIRAILPLLYAHWEGFVKIAASSYLEYVCNLRLRYCDLNNSFVAIGMGRQFLRHGIKSRNISSHLISVNFMRDGLTELAKIPKGGLINTKSNLTSQVFSEILMTVGLDATPYKTKFNFIDERIVGKRNAIAHGDFLDISEHDLLSTTEEVVGLLRRFKNDIQNAIALKNYLKNAEPASSGDGCQW